MKKDSNQPDEEPSSLWQNNMPELDYYKILGVEKQSSPQQLKETFRNLAFQYHPDRNRCNPKAAEKMKQINEAYAVLSDPEKRKQYDSLQSRFGKSAYGKFRSGYTDQEIFAGSDLHRIFDELSKGFGFRGVDEVFTDFYGKGYQRFQVKRPVFFTTGFVFTNLFGPSAAGLKKWPLLFLASKAIRHVIQKISGIAIPAPGNDLFDTIELTPAQAVEGGPFAYFMKQTSKRLVINIPKGVREGQQIRLTGLGKSNVPGTLPGDLYLKVVYWKPWSQKLQDAIRRLLGKPS